MVRKKSIQPTASRIIVLRHLLKKGRAVSLKQLEIDLERSDKSTLYRTLKTFEKNKIIHAIDDGSKNIKYALCLEHCSCRLDEQHFHFHCTQCEETFCLTQHNVPSIQLPSNFKIESANLVLKGSCANCN